MISFELHIDYPLIIDGGLSNELERLGCDLDHPLWSARTIMENPEAVIATHLNYLRAGAQCIATVSYQASIPGLVNANYSVSEAIEIIRRSVSLAEQAVEQFMKDNPAAKKPLIAASIGPYGAYLADGSEYTGSYTIDNVGIHTFHSDKIAILSSTNADIYAFETIPNQREAQVLADLVNTIDKPAWISFACKDGGHISDGTPIEECIALFTKKEKVIALGVNCTAPKYISELIHRIQKVIGEKKIIIYPNSGESYHVATKSWLPLNRPQNFGLLSKEWLDLGVSIIGGCCRIGPEQISEIKSVL